MRPSVLVAVCASALAFGAAAKLPPPTDEAKAKAAEAANRTSWNDKVAAYQLCQAQDKIAATFRKTAAAAGKAASAADAAPPCAEPGPYTPLTPEASKPLSCNSRACS